MTTGLTREVAGFCQKHSLIAQRDRIVIGVSGGPDSLCLLHILINLKAEFQLNLTVAHFNHQLRGDEAQADEKFVRAVAARRKLPVYVETEDVARLAADRKQSVEEAARQVRYAFLWQVAGIVSANKIAVGHNADDQVETVLMHFLRGTGPAGLRGMLPQVNIAALRLNPDDIAAVADKVSPPQLIRPLLETPRSEIEAYCQIHNLTPRQDYSNQDTTFFRNRLRHELVPYLESYNPNIKQVVQHTASVVAADFEILQEQLNKSWRTIAREESSEKIEFDLEDWSRLPLALKRSSLRRAVRRLRRSLRDITFEHIDHVISILEQGKTGTKATLPQGLMVFVGYDSFAIASEDRLPYFPETNMPHLEADQTVPIRLPGSTPLPGTSWQVTADFLTGSTLNRPDLIQVGPWEAYLDAEVVGQTPILRSRRPGDRFHPLGMRGHRQKVSDFMINEKIPADQRDYIPLLVADGEVLWVCGHRPDERARLRPATRSILHLKFERR